MRKFDWQKMAKKEASNRGRMPDWLYESASAKQIETIRKLGVTCQLEHVTKGQAGEMIQQLVRGVEPHWVEKLFKLKA